MKRNALMRRVRRGKARGRAFGFIVTWDVDSSDRSSSGRVRRFVFGDTVCVKGRLYHYPGLIERDGVRYLGQSVLFVPSSLLSTIDSRLTAFGVDHEAIPAWLG